MTEARRPIAEMPLRVRYQECDGQGIVFNAHYLAYVDMCSFEAEKALFGSHEEFVAHGVDVVVAEANLTFRAPARHDDELVVSQYPAHLGTTSLIFDFEIHRGETLLLAANLRYVFIDPATLRPTPPPEEVRKVYAGLLGG
ncbi:thioesterase family protein [Amycolatopsis sp. NPDC026612]|uniref:acyl-CoA thioesterase n=1 Tax=Amycolatopsis sp. NPDC026612 TaxID=3155466 RepID=UPI00340CEFBF